MTKNLNDLTKIDNTVDSDKYLLSLSNYIDNGDTSHISWKNVKKKSEENINKTVADWEKRINFIKDRNSMIDKIYEEIEDLLKRDIDYFYRWTDQKLKKSLFDQSNWAVHGLYGWINYSTNNPILSNVKLESPTVKEQVFLQTSFGVNHALIASGINNLKSDFFKDYPLKKNPMYIWRLKWDVGNIGYVGTMKTVFCYDITGKLAIHFDVPAVKPHFKKWVYTQ